MRPVLLGGMCSSMETASWRSGGKIHLPCGRLCTPALHSGGVDLVLWEELLLP